MDAAGLEEEEFDRRAVFCRQKLLLNILFAQKIAHDCPVFKKKAVAKAAEMWEDNVTKAHEEESVQESPDVGSGDEEAITEKQEDVQAEGGEDEDQDRV